jgi:hypothetical protein
MMAPEPAPEHAWLQRMVGEWTMAGECQMGPGQPPERTRGSEVVRAIGALWVVGEGTCATTDGGGGTNIITLGFDPQKQRFVGSFVNSMMPMLWIYEGTLDAAQGVLTLDCDGPDFAHPGRMTKYQDVVTLTPDGRRLLASSVLGEDGRWHPIMQSEYRRR